MAKFDIIIPVYNTSAYLKACINSVLNQSYQDFRIIAVDDKSIDNSLKILRKYEEKYPDKIKVIECPINVGPGEARNMALRMTDAEYVTFLDSDDTLELTLFEKVVDIIEQYNPDMVIPRIQLSFDKLNLSFLGLRKQISSKSELIIPREFKKHLYTARAGAASRFFKRNIITTEFPNIKWEDYPFVIPYLASSNSIFYLNDVGYYYRVNPFNTTIGDMTKFKPRVLDIFTGSDIIVETMGGELCNHYSDELRITKTINCLQRVKDLCFVTNISKEDRMLLANYLVNLINVREGNFQELEFYQRQKEINSFYRIRMEMMEKLIRPDLQQETNQEIIKQKIKDITKKYQ